MSGTAAADPTPTPTPAGASAASDPIADIKQRARQTGKRIEIEQYRSETTTIYANPDGKSLYAEVHSTPIRVRKNGVWQNIDTTLVEKDGVITPKAAIGDLTLSAGGETFLAKIDGDKGETKVFAPGRLPKPVLKDNTATYRDAYGKGVDLVVTATPAGFHQEIVLRQRPARAPKLKLGVDLPKGLRYGKDSKGKPALIAAKSTNAKSTGSGQSDEVTTLAPALMLDATAKEDPNAGRTAKAAVTIGKDGEKPALELAPNAEFLSDPATAFPVTIAAASDEWYGASRQDDTFVNNAAYPDGLANSTLNRILVGKSNSGTVTWRGYIRFDIAGSPLMGGTVLNADLRLWNYRANACTWQIESGILVRKITSNWSVATLTWSNQPSTTSAGQYGNKGAYSDDCPNGEGELYYSIENITQSWMNGDPDYGVQLRAVSESDLTNWRWYRSFEYGGYGGGSGRPRGPVLFVNYVPAPVEDLEVIRSYPADQPIPESSYEEDKEWAESGNIFPDEESVEPPTITPEAALANAKANNSSTDELPLMDAYYPEGITDEELVEGLEPEASDPTLPPPTPAPTPTPKAPEKVLNANPYFETETAPWTAQGGTVERSTDRAHEPDGTASAKIVPAAEATEVTVQSEPDIAVNPSYLYGAAGWFHPVGADVTVKYGIDWFDGEGTLIDSTLSEQTLARDTWSPIELQEFPPATAAKGQLRLTVTTDPAAPVTLYADELKLLGPENGSSPGSGQEQTITLPLQANVWIDNDGTRDATGSTMWVGVWNSGSQKLLDRTYLLFDAGALAGKTIVNATLRLRNTESYGCGNSNSGIKVQRVTSPWNTSTLRWSNQPTATSEGEAVAKDPVPCSRIAPSGHDWNWTVTDIVKAWAGGAGTHGLLLRGNDESASAAEYDRGFASRSASAGQRPVLTVTYIEPTAPQPTGSATPTATPTGGNDTTPPTVLRVDPPDDGTAAPDAVVTVRFSEPVTRARLTLTDLIMDEPVRGRTSMSPDGRTLTFTPNEYLWSFYEAEVSGATDAAGNTMTEPYVWYFAAEGIFSAANRRLDAAKADSLAKSRDTAPTIETLRVRGADSTSDKTVVPTTQPHLMVKVDDELGRKSTVEIEVAHDPAQSGQGTGEIWSTTVKEVAPDSTVSVQMPSDKIQNGWGIRWRARATTTETSGSWSAWQPLSVEGAEPQLKAQAQTLSTANSAPSPEKVKEVLPQKKVTNPPDVTYTECMNNSLTRTGYRGYVKNRFTACRLTNWVSRHYKNKEKVGEAKGRVLMRVRSEVNARRMEVSLHVFVDSQTGTLRNKPHKFVPVAKKASWGPVTRDPCRHINSTGMVDRFYTLNEWTAASSTQWHLTRRYENLELGNNYHNFSNCSLSISFGFVGNNVKWGRHLSPYSVRCDTSPTIGWHRQGGCVLLDAIPALSFGRNDVSEKNVKLTEIYDHNKEALTNGGKNTIPKAGGRAFPEDRGEKNIPGGSPRDPLLRALRKVDVEANRGRATATCTIEFGKPEQGKTCDEFPYASAHPGAALADIGGRPTFNFSVKYVPKDQNEAHGIILNAWYANNRIVRGDEFWVKLR